MKKLLLALVTFACVGAWADMASMSARLPKLVELKEQGLLGEKRDGMIGVVKQGGEAASVADAENKDRLAIYQERANAGKVGLPEFLKIMGEQRIQKEPGGRYIQDGSGNWVKK